MKAIKPKSAIGEVIDELCAEQGVLISYVYELAEIAPTTLWDLRCGNRDPDLHTLVKIAKVFGLGAGDLLVLAGYTTKGERQP